MKSVYVWGTPEGLKEEIYIDLTKQIINIFENQELGPVVVFFPPERMKWDLGKEIIVYISGPGLPQGEEGQYLAICVGIKVRDVFSPELINCVVLDEPKVGEGRWSWSKSSKS